MEDKLKLIADYFGKTRVKFNEPIKNHAALGVGGPAKLFIITFTKPELLKVIKMTLELKLPIFIFGSGSKMMISDKGFDGVVVKNRTKNISIVGVKGKVKRDGIGVDEALIEVDSGVSMQTLVEFLDKQGLESSELKNLPGTIGGNIFLNRTLLQKVQTIKVIEQGEVEEIKSEELNLRRHIVLSTIFKFNSKY